MDNLAHALTGIAASALISPKVFKKHKTRLALSSAAIANIPDIDFLLNIFGQTVYHFHHRGLTHSFVGLPLIFGLAYFAMWLIWRKKLKENFTTRSLFIWLLTQLLFCHFFLDFLTSYGVMLVYPLSMSRYAFPLMFIIDPVMWLILSIGSFFILRRSQEETKFRKAGIVVLAMVLGWWTVLSTFKATAEHSSFPHSYGAEAYPAPLAPLGWLVIDHDKHPIDMSLVSFYPKIAPRVKPQAIPMKLIVNDSCQQMGFSRSPAFYRYKRWAGDVLCEDAPSEGTCICHSARYGFGVSEGRFYFGSVKIDYSSVEFVQFSRQHWLADYQKAFFE